ncbi:Hypothetical_protein [Hexamita inflata]|uniref:Hypothetical_protein n=1 Tax=Hexamita inflata TaxID=28002 RepID=A0ABP1JVI6_9EUKA
MLSHYSCNTNAQISSNLQCFIFIIIQTLFGQIEEPNHNELHILHTITFVTSQFLFASLQNVKSDRKAEYKQSILLNAELAMADKFTTIFKITPRQLHKRLSAIQLQQLEDPPVTPKLKGKARFVPMMTLYVKPVVQIK